MTDDQIKRAEEEISLHPSLAVGGRWEEAYYALIARVKELEAEVDGAYAIIADERAAVLWLREKVRLANEAQLKAEAALTLRVEVKPLVWEGDGFWSHGPDEGWMEEACTSFGWGYSIEFGRHDEGNFIVDSTFRERLTGFDTPDAAKAAAQADYEARILSAIEAVDPATIRAEALRDVCKAVLDAYDKANPFRTADYHGDGCDCFRCRMDAMRAIIDKEQDQ